LSVWMGVGMYAVPVMWLAFVRKGGHPVSVVRRLHAVMWRRADGHAMARAWGRLLCLGRRSVGRRYLGRGSSEGGHSMHVVLAAVAVVRGRDRSIMCGGQRSIMCGRDWAIVRGWEGPLMRRSKRTFAWRWEGSFPVSFSVKRTTAFPGCVTNEIHIFLFTIALTLFPFLFSISPVFEGGTRAGVGWTMGLLHLGSGSCHLLICSAFIEDEDAGGSCQQGL